jgi:hypothetical protein
MKNIIKFIIIILLLPIIISCGSGILNLKKGFTTYRLPILLQNKETPKISIKTDGIYVPKENNGSVFYFYDNGSVKWEGWTNNFWQNPAKKIENIQNGYFYISKEYWGQYSINNDSILIQIFIKNNEKIITRWIFEYEGIILNDSSFILYSCFSYLGKDNFIDKSEEYAFYKTITKPDSTKAWFNNRRWFKKDLHESRKVKK